MRPALARRNGRGGEKWGLSPLQKKIHRGAIAPYQIITAWIGIPGSSAFLLPFRPPVCPRAASGRGPPATAPGSPNGRGGGKTGRGGGPPFPQAHVVPEHTIWGDSGVGTDGVVRHGPRSAKAKAAIADHGPLTEAGWTRCGGGSRAGAWRGCELAGAPLFPVTGPKACVRAGGRLAPRGPASSKTPRCRMRAPCRGLGPESSERSWRCGNF